MKKSCTWLYFQNSTTTLPQEFAKQCYHNAPFSQAQDSPGCPFSSATVKHSPEKSRDLPGAAASNTAISGPKGAWASRASILHISCWNISEYGCGYPVSPSEDGLVLCLFYMAVTLYMPLWHIAVNLQTLMLTRMQTLSNVFWISWQTVRTIIWAQTLRSAACFAMMVPIGNIRMLLTMILGWSIMIYGMIKQSQ